ncbi:hypothetical protein AB0M46_08030 [Dactylosporangium sp. NPDC051485]|uniref:hypothetical protein n=1 Tax=Dactylosporangium sp. NPDC051485 TaxID=3154846 RepID=UPI00343E26B4
MSLSAAKSRAPQARDQIETGRAAAVRADALDGAPPLVTELERRVREGLFAGRYPAVGPCR